MGVAVSDGLSRLLGGGIERQRLIGAMVLLEWLLGIGAVDRARGRQHEVPARMPPQRLQQVEGADDIGVKIRVRILGGVAHAGLPGEMDHDVGFSRGHSAGEPHGILEHQLPEGEISGCREQPVAGALEGGIVIASDTVDAEHRVPIGEQALRQMEADEARGAGDQKAHAVSLIQPLLAVAKSPTQGHGCRANSARQAPRKIRLWYLGRANSSAATASGVD